MYHPIPPPNPGPLGGRSSGGVPGVYVPLVQPFGDSNVRGDGCETKAGFRERLYTVANGGLRFVGSQSFAGAGGGLAVNPQHEGHAFYYIRDGGTPAHGSLINFIDTGGLTQYGPDLAILEGGTNDIALGGDSAATVLANFSTYIDRAYAYRTKSWMRIVVLNIFKRLDAFDATVQTVNAGLAAVVAGKSFASVITLIDVYDAAGVGGMADDVHYNDVGATNIANAIWAGGFQTALTAARP